MSRISSTESVRIKRLRSSGEIAPCPSCVFSIQSRRPLQYDES